MIDKTIDQTIDQTTDQTRQAELTVQEWMRGYIGVGATDFMGGYVAGVDQGNDFMFGIKFDFPDVGGFLGDTRHEAAATGYVDCDLLGGRLELEDTSIQLFISEESSRCRYLRYRLFFTSPTRGPLTMFGFKVLFNDRALDMWPDITTLYIRVLEGHVREGDDDGAETIAMGIVRIRTWDFVKTMLSFRFPQVSLATPVRVARFTRLFLGEVWRVYGR